MRSMKRFIALVLIGLVLFAGSCEEDEGQRQAQTADAGRRQASVESQVAKQTDATTDYPPTGATINCGIVTWDEPGKLACVYLQAANGQLLGYHILEGPPVSMCASITPTYDFVDADEFQSARWHEDHDID